MVLVPLDFVLEKVSGTEHLLMLKLSGNHQRARGAQRLCSGVKCHYSIEEAEGVAWGLGARVGVGGERKFKFRGTIEPGSISD